MKPNLCFYTLVFCAYHRSPVQNVGMDLDMSF